MDNKILNEYTRWCKKATVDADLVNELRAMEGNDDLIIDAFYRELEFGTGGLRGVIGAGMNRMNIYTVGKASLGLANYVCKHYAEGNRSIAISYDSRIKSDVFAKAAATIFANAGLHVYIYPYLMPTPCLSFAVRELKCQAGIMVTASHNPSKYNGYKVYGSDGCQITTEAADEILNEIGAVDVFDDVRIGDFDQMMKDGQIEYISEDVYTAFVEKVKGQTMLTEKDVVNKNVAIVYSPLNGTGLKPVTRTLKECGFTNITVVKEQENPDGHFPTCPYPNPEIKEAMALGMKYAAELQADLLLATDPDCDRAGIAVRDKDGNYRLLTGNETGMLLLDYVCSRRVANGKMPKDPVCVKTIVTIDMAERIAKKYGVRTVNVLTGFKFIGEQIALLEKEGKEDSYIFGFEESYGYLTGSYVRDKDAVDASMLICEMFAYYNTLGIGLLDKLNELYEEFGYCLNTLHSYTFEGITGFDKMKQIMVAFRKPLTQFGPKKIEKVLDYSMGIDGLPKADVIKYLLDGNASVVVRPSGTEPKLKTYISISAPTKEEAMEIEKKVSADLEEFFK